MDMHKGSSTGENAAFQQSPRKTGTVASRMDGWVDKGMD
jgi:hypothetical protein